MGHPCAVAPVCNRCFAEKTIDAWVPLPLWGWGTTTRDLLTRTNDTAGNRRPFRLKYP